jgi:hypothetical protein
MSMLRCSWPIVLVILLAIPTVPAIAQPAFSVDEDPRETAADPGDTFFSASTCDADDGDGSCASNVFNVPSPNLFDLDAVNVEATVEVCPANPPYTAGILFSIDDGDPGPGSGSPDNHTEIFFYDHCHLLGPGGSYHTSVKEASLGLGNDPPPIDYDDDVDAYSTRSIGAFYNSFWPILFSPDIPSNGGLGAGSEAHIWSVSMGSPTPTIWAGASEALGVPDPDHCDIDGITLGRLVNEQDWFLLFTTDAEADCGLDPGDIWLSLLYGSHSLYADDVTDLKIAVNEFQMVDIDALAVNEPPTGIEIIDPYDPPADEIFFKADWPNYAPSGVPDISQDHIQWPGTWCGPVAVANSLWWYDSEFECDRDRIVGDPAETEPNDTCDVADPLGEEPLMAGGLAGISDVDWFAFELPAKRQRTCRVMVSTCALRQPGDQDTVLSLYDGCSATGTPGDLIASNDDGCPPDSQSEIEVDLQTGKRYLVEVQSGPSSGFGGYHFSLGVDCSPVVQRDPDAPDDHSEYDPVPLVEYLVGCMNTDDAQGTGSGHTGTTPIEMRDCISSYIHARNLEDVLGATVSLNYPFNQIARWIEESFDIILNLGFWWQEPGTTDWIRCGGHYVTAAGVDRAGGTISLSDPALNNAETGAPGRVRGPNHADHAPAVGPPPDHDDMQNVSQDRYQAGPSLVNPGTWWSLPAYATDGTPTTCADVARWCMDPGWGQNPSYYPAGSPQEPCPDDAWLVSTEVELTVRVSFDKDFLCVFLDQNSSWPDNLRMRKGICNDVEDATPKDLIRGKLCNLRIPPTSPVPMIDLGHVQCLYDDSNRTEFGELSPNYTECMGAWFYLIRNSGDAHYGSVGPSMRTRLPDTGGCP